MAGGIGGGGTKKWEGDGHVSWFNAVIYKDSRHSPSYGALLKERNAGSNRDLSSTLATRERDGGKNGELFFAIGGGSQRIIAA